MRRFLSKFAVSIGQSPITASLWKIRGSPPIKRFLEATQRGSLIPAYAVEIFKCDLESFDS